MFAPDSPVVINGNAHKFKGFAIAESYVSLTTAEDYTKKKDENGDDKFYDSNGSLIVETNNYAEHKCATHGTIHNNKMYVDDLGNVQYKKSGGSYIPAVDFKLAESNYDSFNLIRLEYYIVSDSSYMTDNLFTTANAKMMT